MSYSVAYAGSRRGRSASGTDLSPGPTWAETSVSTKDKRRECFRHGRGIHFISARESIGLNDPAIRGRKSVCGTVAEMELMGQGMLVLVFGSIPGVWRVAQPGSIAVDAGSNDQQKPHVRVVTHLHQRWLRHRAGTR